MRGAIAKLRWARACGGGARRWGGGVPRHEGVAKETADVVVIGAGVVGIAVARELALKGRDVLVLESAPTFGTGTSSRNSEVVHAGIYYPRGSLKVREALQPQEEKIIFSVLLFPLARCPIGSFQENFPRKNTPMIASLGMIDLGESSDFGK